MNPVQVGQLLDGTNMILDLRSQTEWFSFWSGEYDDEIISLVQALCRRTESDFLDVGGNIGMYAVRVARRLGAGKRSASFEPMPQNAIRITENARLNGVEDRVEVYQVALSDHEGEATLVLREDFRLGSETGNASIAISDNADGNFNTVKVPADCFDTLMRSMTTSSFLIAKLDIEGHEDFFLRGAQAWLNRSRPILFVEINNWYFAKRNAKSSELFAASLPHDYECALIKMRAGKIELERCTVHSLSDISTIETCLMYHPERNADISSCLKRDAR